MSPEGPTATTIDPSEEDAMLRKDTDVSWRFVNVHDTLGVGGAGGP